MRDEYISKQDAVDTIPKERIVEYMDEFGAGYNSCRNDTLRSIESITPADVAPVVHGKWMKEESIKKAIIFFAKLIYRLSLQGKIYLSNKENTFIEYLRRGDFEAFNKEGWIW